MEMGMLPITDMLTTDPREIITTTEREGTTITIDLEAGLTTLTMTQTEALGTLDKEDTGQGMTEGHTLSNHSKATLGNNSSKWSLCSRFSKPLSSLNKLTKDNKPSQSIKPLLNKWHHNSRWYHSSRCRM
jgi:hypothetical protein